MDNALAAADWSVVVLYLGITLCLGLYFTRRGTSSVTEYFVAGRKLSWWLAGSSIVATSFAADTPLAIARLVRTAGLQANWYWWCGVMGFVACVFFFAPRWRRSGLITDVEFIELRYAGRPAKALRIFLALYKAVLENGITMGWVILGMQKIAVVSFGWPRETAIPALVLAALVYTLFSGLWGVVVTDLFQFCLAMFASICLMVIVLWDAGGPARLAETVVAKAGDLAGVDLGSKIADASQVLSILPNFDAGGLVVLTFLFYVLVQWWGGAEGGGFLVQRLFSTKSERHAVLALVWFTVAHFGLRCWPWIIVGLASIIHFPDLADPEAAYPRMMMAFLPVGLKGVMVASLLAAFMSTISTHLNWGASYLLNDIYRPYLRGGATERHYVRAAQVFVLCMALLAGLSAWQMTSIFGAWLYLSELAAGAVLVHLARWYWWRVNAWSQISALAASLVISNGLRLSGALAPLLARAGLPSLAGIFSSAAVLSQQQWYPARFCITLLLSTLVWVLVTLRTRPVPRTTLEAFYGRVRPDGWWGPVAQQDSGAPPAALAPLAAGWLLGVAAIYLCVFGLGWVLLGAFLRGALALMVAAVSGSLMLRTLGHLKG